MATLEVHDGRGRVEFVTISREQSILFGSSPKCDIVLDVPGVLPFHGRLRWKESRYKVDASPDAQYLEINGHRMTSASFRQGDEIAIGACRIFMLNVDEDLPRDDLTRIQAPPISPPEPPEPATPPRQAEPARPRPLPRRKSRLERDDWAKDLEVAPPSVETEVEEPERLPVKPPPRKPRPPRPERKLREVLGLREAAPGQERVLTSPLVIGLAIALVVLVGLGFALHAIIAETAATRLYQRAVESLDDGDYRNAIRRFDEYLAGSASSQEHQGKARVLRALANVRQFTSTTGASWSNALEAERAMVDSVGREATYRDASPELAELVLKTGESLADRARASADPGVLAEAESALALHKRVAGQAADAMLGRSRFPAKLAEARAAVRKAAIRVQALAAMDAALKARSSAGVYKARDALLRRYADLAEDRELVARLTRANDLIRDAVTFDAARRPASTAPFPDPAGPPISLVLRSGDATPATAPQAPVFALADGIAYGLDGASGTPLWQLPVGSSAPFPPRAVPGGTTALAFDSRDDALIRVEARSGTLVWRQPLGEPVADPPLILGNQLVQSTRGGKVHLIDLATGELRGTFALGLRLAHSPVSDESGQFLYVLAEQDCLFVLTRDPPSCKAVEYLGQAAGSIPCPPARLGRFLVVAENHAPTSGRWRVCLLDEDGARVRQVQEVAVPGWTWDTPASSGSVLWATGDRGGVAAYAVGSYEAASPLRPIARLASQAESSGPAFALAHTEEELWLASGRSGRYNLDLEKGEITTPWTLAGAGAALAPVQASGPLVVTTHQDPERAGVDLRGIDPQSGAVRWRTVLGTSWPVALSRAPDGEELTTLGGDGQVLTISRPRLDSGGFLESPLPRPREFRLPVGPLRRLEGGGLTVLVPPPGSPEVLVRADRGAFRRVDLPVAPAAMPVFWGRELLVPGVDGRAYLVDPSTGESRAEPFVPTFDRAHPTRWRGPVRVNGDAVALADESGRVRLLTRQDEPRPRLAAAAEATLGADLAADPAATGAAIVLATADGRIRSLAARDLSPVGAWPLDSPLALPPTAVAGRVFVADRAGGLLCFGQDGQRLWTASTRGAAVVGAPVVLGSSAWFLTRSGSLEAFSLEEGAAVDRAEFGILPAGAPLALGDDLVLPVANGTVRRFPSRRRDTPVPP